MCTQQRLRSARTSQVFFMQTAKTLIRLGRCWVAQSFCWFCHETAQISFSLSQLVISQNGPSIPVRLKYFWNRMYRNIPDRSGKQCTHSYLDQTAPHELHCLQFYLHLWNALLYNKASLFILSFFLGVWIFTVKQPNNHRRANQQYHTAKRKAFRPWGRDVNSAQTLARVPSFAWPAEFLADPKFHMQFKCWTYSLQSGTTKVTCLSFAWFGP